MGFGGTRTTHSELAPDLQKVDEAFSVFKDGSWGMSDISNPVISSLVESAESKLFSSLGQFSDVSKSENLSEFQNILNDRNNAVGSIVRSIVKLEAAISLVDKNDPIHQKLIEAQDAIGSYVKQKLSTLCEKIDTGNDTENDEFSQRALTRFEECAVQYGYSHHGILVAAGIEAADIAHKLIPIEAERLVSSEDPRKIAEVLDSGRKTLENFNFETDQSCKDITSIASSDLSKATEVYDRWMGTQAEISALLTEGNRDNSLRYFATGLQ